MSIELSDRQLRRLRDALDRLLFLGVAAVAAVVGATIFAFAALAESAALFGLGVAFLGFMLVWFALFTPDHVLVALPGVED